MSSPPESRKERREQARADRRAAEEASAAKARRTRRMYQLGAVAAAAAVVVAIAIVVGLSTGGDDGEQTPAGEEGGQVAGVREATGLFAGLPQDGVVLGDDRAPVTLVEFADLQCPFCAQYSKEVLPTLIRDYVRPGRVRMELRVIDILGPESTNAALVSYGAAQQGKLWEFTELFFANQGQEGSGYVTEDFLRSIAEATPGLDADRALAAQRGGQADRMLSEAQGLAQARGISSTPSFLVGSTGGTLRALELQTLDVDEFRRQVDEVLNE